MSEQKEKTALELVDEIIACPGCPSIKHLTCLKSAIERERDAMMADIQRLQVAIGQNQAEFDRAIKDMNARLQSAVTMRPISELPDRVPDECGCVMVDSHGVTMCKTYATHFYILPLPKAERKLHPCYMPGCGGQASIFVSIDGDGYFVHCDKCGATGPVRADKDAAKQAWGYAE